MKCEIKGRQIARTLKSDSKLENNRCAQKCKRVNFWLLDNSDSRNSYNPDSRNLKCPDFDCPNLICFRVYFPFSTIFVHVQNKAQMYKNQNGILPRPVTPWSQAPCTFISRLFPRFKYHILSQYGSFISNSTSRLFLTLATCCSTSPTSG